MIHCSAEYRERANRALITVLNRNWSQLKNLITKAPLPTIPNPLCYRRSDLSPRSASALRTMFSLLERENGKWPSSKFACLGPRLHVIIQSKYSGQVRPRQGTEICNFGAPSPLEALHWIFCFVSSIYVQFSKTSPLKSGESSEKSSGENRVKSCHICGCHGFLALKYLKIRLQKLSI